MPNIGTNTDGAFFVVILLGLFTCLFLSTLLTRFERKKTDDI